MATGRFCLNAVSYTHLDVYKRQVVSSLTAYGPGYIDESMKDLEQIVGLQTDKPLKRAFMPLSLIHI